MPVRNDTETQPEKPLLRLLRRIALSEDAADDTPEAIYMAEILKSCGTGDRLEEMLMAQIAVTHEAALHYLALAAAPRADINEKAEGLAASLKFSRLMTDHARTLQKCRKPAKSS